MLAWRGGPKKLLQLANVRKRKTAGTAGTGANWGGGGGGNGGRQVSMPPRRALLPAVGAPAVLPSGRCQKRHRPAGEVAQPAEEREQPPAQQEQEEPRAPQEHQRQQAQHVQPQVKRARAPPQSLDLLALAMPTDWAAPGNSSGGGSQSTEAASP